MVYTYMYQKRKKNIYFFMYLNNSTNLVYSTFFKIFKRLLQEMEKPRSTGCLIFRREAISTKLVCRSVRHESHFV